MMNWITTYPWAQPMMNAANVDVATEGRMPRSPSATPMVAVRPSMSMGNRRLDGLLETPATTMPSREPPPKPDRIVPKATAPPSNRVSASTGMPTDMGPVISRLTAAMSTK